MMKLLLTFIILLSSNFAFSLGWEDFKEEAMTPLSPEVKNVTIYGALTTVLVVTFEDHLNDPAQEEAVENRPLGKWSRLGDLAGQMVPNGLYSIGIAYGVGISKHDRNKQEKSDAEKVSFNIIPIYDFQTKGIALVGEF
jgi:hypothetical protein